MKSIVKIDKKGQEAAYYKSSKNNSSGQPPKTSHGKGKKPEKDPSDHSPPNNDEERKGVKDYYRQGIKNKPKTLINKKLPDVFSNPQIKYKGSKNSQYIKQPGMKSDQSTLIHAGRDERLVKYNSQSFLPIF